MEKTKLLGILYIDRAGIAFFVDGQDEVLRFLFPEGSVRDLEVLTPDILVRELTSFLDKQKVAPARLLAVLSPTLLFQRDIEDTREVSLEIATQAFLEAIPFENVASRTYEKEGRVRLIATNRNFYEPLILTFTKRGFVFEGIVPSTFIEEPLLVERGLESDTALSLLKRYDTLKQYSLMNVAKPADEGSSHTTSQGTKKKRAFLIAFAIISFLLLLFILLRQ